MNSRLIAGIKRRLPISSRSFRDFRAQDDARYARLLHVIDDQRKALDKAQESLDRLEKQCRALNETLEYVHDSNSVMYWQLFRGDHETTEQAQLRFFRGLPKAKGIHALFQDAEARLFELFDQFCRDHGISYWGTGGTVLGAFRQQDFIPWDDDIDVYITREQLRRLEKAVREDGRFRVTVVWDWYVPCKQIRFRSIDEANPCFVDLFPLDWVSGDPEDAWQVCTQERVQFVQEIRKQYQSSSWSRDIYISGADPLIPTLESDLHAHLEDLATRVSVLPTADGATGLIRGIENIDEVRQSGPYLTGNWTGSTTLPFRGISVPVPRNYREYLSKAYGDYMALPRDMHSHEHVTDEYIASPESVRAMRRIISADGERALGDEERK